MTKKIYTTLFLSIILVGCSQVSTPNTNDSRETALQNLQKTEEQSDIQESDQVESNTPEVEIETPNVTNIMAEALSSLDENICNNIENKADEANCKDAVALQIALDTNNIDTCESMADTNKQENCRDQVLETMAKNVLSFDACEEITSVDRKLNCKQEIIYKTAVSEKNANICETLDKSYTELYNRCQEKILESTHQEIFYEATQVLFDASICQSIQDANMRTQCSDIANLKDGVRSKDLEKCRSIQSENTRNKCFNAVLIPKAISEKNIALCNEIIENEARSECQKTIQATLDKDILRSVQKNGDTAQCEKIVNTTVQAQCEKL